MDAKLFHPELIGYAQKAQQALEERNIRRGIHYDDIDARHDIFGLHVCDVREEGIAKKIDIFLQEFFDDLPQGQIYTVETRYHVIRSRGPPSYKEETSLSN